MSNRWQRLRARLRAQGKTDEEIKKAIEDHKEKVWLEEDDK